MQGGVRLTGRPMHGLAAEDHPDEARRAEVGDGEGAVRAEEGAGRGRHPALEQLRRLAAGEPAIKRRCSSARAQMPAVIARIFEHAQMNTSAQ